MHRSHPVCGTLYFKFDFGAHTQKQKHETDASTPVLEKGLKSIRNEKKVHFRRK